MDKSLWSSVAESAAYEWVLILSFVFGGCCSNVWALEAMLKKQPKSGTFLTFAQFLYVSVQTISSQLYVPPKPDRFLGLPIPVLRPRKVPIQRWMGQVAFFLAISLMNNVAFGLNIPVPVNIIFRSGGLCVSMFIGWLFGGRRYGVGQVAAGLIITTGIVIATISAPRRKHGGHGGATTASTSSAGWMGENLEYIGGIGLLSGALILAAGMGLFQEETYRRYGKQWRESLFYSHFLSLPFFIPLYPSLSTTFASFVQSPPVTLLSIPYQPSAFASLLSLDSMEKAANPLEGWKEILVPSAILALVVNIVTQGICVRGVNRLASRVNNVTVNLILTLRKAVSLGISVWYYGSGFNRGLAIGGGMVLGGTILYSLAPGPSATLDTKKTDGVDDGSTQNGDKTSATGVEVGSGGGARQRHQTRETKSR